MNYHKKFFYFVLHLCFRFNLILQVQSNFNTKNTFDEKKARNLVKILLEKDISYYKNLIPTIDTFNSEDFMNLFDGNSDHNYNTPKIANIKRLAYKFENFSPILYEFYDDNKSYEYLIELWVEYPNMENLILKDADKISSELSSILPNYSSWPNNIKKKLIKSIKNIKLVCKEIKKKIEKEYQDIDAVLKNLTKIIEIFSAIKDDEYLAKNKNFYYNYFFKGILEKTNKNISINEIINITINSIPKNFESQMDSIFYSILGTIKYVNKENTKGIIELYKKKLVYKSLHIENISQEYIDNIISIKDININDEITEKQKQWSIVAKNFIYCIYRGVRLYEAIQSSKKLGGDNEYQKKLDEISEEFEMYRNSKQLEQDDLIKSSEIIIASIKKLEKIRQDLLNLIGDLKKKINENINKKKEDFGSMLYNGLSAIFDIYSIVATDNPFKIFTAYNALLSTSNAVMAGLDISYLNEILDGLTEILGDSYNKKDEIEKEIKLLKRNELELRKAYPK